MISFIAENNYIAKENTICGKIDLSSFIKNDKFNAKNAWINVGGWQSWNPGYEIASGKKQDSLKCHLIHQWNQYLVFPGTKSKATNNIVLAQFICYFRWKINNENKYLFLVSTGNLNNKLPPVQFIINRNTNIVKIELCDFGKTWKKGDLQAQIQTFIADSYFEAKEKLISIFGTSDRTSPNYSPRFDQLNHFDSKIYGWESWYNHYSKIDEKLICEDLYALHNSENLITKNAKSNVVFQIDDGWEKSLGDWQWNQERFPKGPEYLTKEIESKGYIPGLWVAPFIIDSRSKTAINHPEWLLKDNKGHLIPAGFNPLWGKNGTFYCLDLSISEVNSYLEELVETIINKWGFRYIKFDFLYAGVLQGNHKYSGASYEYFQKTLDLLTSHKADKNNRPVTYLGCGCPFELSYNNLPLSRIGCDTFEKWENILPKKLNWNGRNSAFLNLKDTLGHAIWDKVIFVNDPDVIFIREDNCTLSKDEKILIGAINTMFGSQIMYSDDPSKEATENEIKITNEITELIKKLQNQNFAVENDSKNTYRFWNMENTIKGKIDLDKNHKIIFEK